MTRLRDTMGEEINHLLVDYETSKKLLTFLKAYVRIHSPVLIEFL